MGLYGQSQHLFQCFLPLPTNWGEVDNTLPDDSPSKCDKLSGE